MDPITSISILVTIILVSIVLFIVIPSLFGASFESTDKPRIATMISLTTPKKNDKIVDLGAGTGEIIIEYAKQGFQAEGFEINPFLVFIGRRKIRSLGLQNKAKLHWKNFWKIDLSKYQIVTIFQIFYVMSKLENKLKKELKSKTKIVSNRWKFPNLKMQKEKNKVYLYEI